MNSMIKGIVIGAMVTLILLACSAFLAFKALGPKALPSISGDAALDGVFSELIAASDYVESETEAGSIDHAQGQRFLLRIIERNLSLMMDDHNGYTPTIARCPSQLCKYGFDNPDTTYVGIGPLKGDLNYRISGTRGNVAYITYQIFNIGPGGFKTGDQMESSNLVVNEYDHYEIYLGPENTENHSNFLELPDNGNARLIIRQLHNDWNAEVEQSLEIEVLDKESTPASAPVFNDKMMGRRGLAMGMMVKNNISNFRDIILNDFELNAVTKPSAGSIGGGGGFPSNITAAGRYELDEDQALIIEVDDVPVIYNNIQLANLWGESLDYGTRTVSYNGSQAYRDSDSKIRYVIAMSDPGVPNWLDASGHPRGAIFMRWQSPDQEIVRPVTQIVPLVDLRDNLPEGHPVIAATERASILRARLSGYNRRKNPAGFANN